MKIATNTCSHTRALTMGKNDDIALCNKNNKDENYAKRIEISKRLQKLYSPQHNVLQQNLNSSNTSKVQFTKLSKKPYNPSGDISDV